MKKVSAVLGVLGGLVALLAVYGRFHGPTCITIMGGQYACGTILVVSCVVLLAANLVGVLGLYDRK